MIILIRNILITLLFLGWSQLLIELQLLCSLLFIITKLFIFVAYIPTILLTQELYNAVITVPI